MKRMAVLGLFVVVLAFSFIRCNHNGVNYEVEYQILNDNTSAVLHEGKILIDEDGASLSTSVVQEKAALKLGFAGSNAQGWTRTLDGVNQRLVFIKIKEHKR